VPVERAPGQEYSESQVGHRECARPGAWTRSGAPAGQSVPEYSRVGQFRLNPTGCARRRRRRHGRAARFNRFQTKGRDCSKAGMSHELVDAQVNP